MRLRLGPATPWYNLVHATVFPPANCLRLLPDVRQRAHRCHWAQSKPRDGTCVSQPFPAVCSHVAAQRSRSLARRYMLRVAAHRQYDDGQTRCAWLSANCLRAAQGKSTVYCFVVFILTNDSLYRCHSAQCSNHTLTLETAYGNITSRRACCSTWCRVSSCRQSTAATCTAFSIACCQQREQV